MYDEERKYHVIDESDPKKREGLWYAASGLQQVDGLNISDYAETVGQSYIAGKLSAYQTRQQLEEYHQESRSRQAEADVVTGRILTMLASAGQSRFRLEPDILKRIHKSLFDGQLDDQRWVGSWRYEVISKAEPVLGGNTVRYENPDFILDALRHDFENEKSFNYPGMLDISSIHHFADFISDIWQIHPFREGNTRTIAVFSQLYLHELGLEPNNDYYAHNSRWFRDALVRASYASIPNSIEEDRTFIYMFFENVALDTGHQLEKIDLNLHGICVDDEIPYRKPGDMTDR